MTTQLSIVLPVRDEASNLERVFSSFSEQLAKMGYADVEWIVVDGDSNDGSAIVAERFGAKVIPQQDRYFGNALKIGFAESNGSLVLTLDADGSHRAEVLPSMFDALRCADLVIASRFLPEGSSNGPAFRTWLSRVLNLIFSRFLNVPVSDMSSGFRLYRREALQSESYFADDFNLQQEIVTRAHLAGFRVVEVPFTYQKRWSGRSKARVLRLLRLYFITLVRLMGLRLFGEKPVRSGPDSEVMLMAGPTPILIPVPASVKLPAEPLAQRN